MAKRVKINRERQVGRMLRGYRREMIVMHTKESPLFESAYFVLRRDREESPALDMVSEANRIIGEGGACLGRKRRRRGAWLLLLGALLGALFVGGIFWVIGR